MSPKQDKVNAQEALRSLSMRKLRSTVDFWSGPDAQGFTVDGKPALFWAVEQAGQARADRDAKGRLRALAVVSWLLEKGLDPNGSFKTISPLMQAAMVGDLAASRRLIKSGAQVNLASMAGNTALHWASMAGRPAMCKLLVEAKASLHAVNDRKQTPLHCAADKMRMNTITVLHEAGAAWDKKDVHDRTPLGVLEHRDTGLAQLWVNRPERDRLSVATDAAQLPPSPKRSRRL